MKRGVTMRRFWLGMAAVGLAAGVLRGLAEEAAPAKPAAEAAKTTLLVSSQGAAGVLTPSLKQEVRAAVNRALDWLAANQKEDGIWSNSEHPALTALPVWAFAQSEHPKKKKVMDKAVKYLVSCAQEDGGIYRKGEKGGGLSGYNTAISMVALHLTGNPAYAPIVQKARKFVAASQHLGDDVYKGGMGYDAASGRAYADLSNTAMAFEAMRLTQGVEDLRPAGEKRVDVDWKAATQFLDKVQNKPEAGAGEAGGFFYRPGESKAGMTTNEAGVVVFRSYGSMTYQGLLSLIYADVSRDDPRVKSAFDWAAKHWTLEENPGTGADGMYYFYNVLAKALAAFGRPSLPTKDGTLDWRAALAQKLLTLQKIEPKNGQGYWKNDSGRWWEADPVLVTSYSLIALQAVAR